MNQLKKWIILLSTICVILIIALIVILSNFTQQEQNIYVDPPTSEEEQHEPEINQKISFVKSEDDFFTLEKQLQNYFLYLKVENQEAVYNLLADSYIQDHQLTKERVIDFVKQNYQSVQGTIFLKQAYVRDSIVKPIYYVCGSLEENQRNTDVYMVVYWDGENGAYAVRPIEKSQYEQYISENLQEENKYEISTKQYNKLERMILSEEDKAIKYFKSYIKNALYHVETAYASLEKEYQQKRFATIENYQQYIKVRKAQLLTMDTDNMKDLKDFATEEEYTNYLNSLRFKSIEKYQFSTTSNQKQCICIDSYGNYYIFNITGAMQYTVILDTYTIDLPEFTAKYEQATDEEKVLMNIQKFFMAIDNGDYAYAYNKLDATFKANNFATQQEFETYVKNTFFASNKLASGTAEKQNDIYLYQITITDKTEVKKESVTKTFVMKLKEGTDFVMSFSK